MNLYLRIWRTLYVVKEWLANVVKHVITRLVCMKVMKLNRSMYIKGFKNKQYTIKLVSNKFNNDSGKRLIVMVLTQTRLVKRVIIILLFKHYFKNKWLWIWREKQLDSFSPAVMNIFVLVRARTRENRVIKNRVRSEKNRSIIQTCICTVVFPF
jgi:hypothetical protein